MAEVAPEPRAEEEGKEDMVVAAGGAGGGPHRRHSSTSSGELDLFTKSSSTIEREKQVSVAFRTGRFVRMFLYHMLLPLATLYIPLFDSVPLARWVAANSAEPARVPRRSRRPPATSASCPSIPWTC